MYAGSHNCGVQMTKKTKSANTPFNAIELWNLKRLALKVPLENGYLG